jgi:hypothetical protein
MSLMVYDLVPGVTLLSADGLMVTLLEKNDTGCWLVVVLDDAYPGAHADSGFVTPLVFREETVEDGGWSVL